MRDMLRMIAIKNLRGGWRHHEPLLPPTGGYLMSEKNITAAFSNVLGNHWQCVFDDQGGHIARIIDGKPVGVFCDGAWCLIFFKLEGTVIETKVAYINRHLPVFCGDHQISCLRFSEKFPDIFVDVDGQPVPCDAILRLSFYARTDAGTLVVTVNPGFAKDARPLTVLVSRRPKVNATLQALAAGWFYEIFAKS